MTKRGEPVTSFLWGYNSQYPIAMLKNASLAEIHANMSDVSLQAIAQKRVPTVTDFSSINNLRDNLFNAEVSTYTYDPLVGVLTRMNPNSNTESFNYDSSGRLSKIKEVGNKTLQTIQYNHSSVATSVSVNFNATSTYIKGATTFTATASGGSGYYVYQWVLKNTSGTVIYRSEESTTNSCSINLQTGGNNTLTCYVRDIITQKEVNTSRSFVVVAHFIQFSNITEFGYSYVGEKSVYADIVCSTATTATFTLEHRIGNSPASMVCKVNSNFSRTFTGRGEATFSVALYAGVNQVSMHVYNYMASYDNLNRCIAKKIPGCDWVYYVYDDNDRIIFTQDGVQRDRSENEWYFAIPDVFGRVVLAGVCTSAPNVNTVNSVSVYATYPQGGTGIYMGYNIPNYTLSDYTILSANYYDSYKFRSLSGFLSSSLSYESSGVDSKYLTRYGADASISEHKGLLTGTATAQLTGSTIPTYLYSVMYYDYRGRVVQTKSTNHLVGGVEKDYIAYTFTNQPEYRTHIHSATGQSTQTEQYTYAYDHAGRLSTVLHRLNNGNEVTLTDNEYDELGRLKENRRNGQDELITSYDYNIRSWIQNISNAHFIEDLSYTPSGNIRIQEWQQAGKTRKYEFSYDPLSRLTDAGYMGDSNYSTSYIYDKQGNITNLSRWGNTGTTTDGKIDDLTLSYSGNQLIKVTDTGVTPSISTSADFRSGSTASIQYLYDANGNLKQDLNKGIGNIAYNSLNLPSSFTISNSLGSATNTYVYSADGRKLKVTKGTFTTDYCGNVIYENDSLKRILVDGGYYENGSYYFYLADHLGNNRVVANQNGSVIQSTQYYPFGMAFADGTNPSAQPYKFGGKELDSDRGLNLYDFHARWQDPALGGRFLSVDPLAEKYYSMSPYVYCMNNPVRFVDPDGRDWYWIDYSDEKKRSLQYDPNITKDSKLGENQKYAGETVKHGTGSYRKDGSIMFSNETDAYNRMWSQANMKESEQSGYALENGNILVIPDHKKEADDASPSKYGYSVKKGILLTKDGESFNITGNIHTHQDPTRDATPSFWTGNNWGDVGHSYGMGGLPVIVMGHDGRIHGVFYSVTHKGYRSIPGFGSRNDLLSGKTKLTQWLKTYPTKGQ